VYDFVDKELGKAIPMESNDIGANVSAQKFAAASPALIGFVTTKESGHNRAR